MRALASNDLLNVSGGDNPGMGPYDAPSSSGSSTLSCPAPASGSGMYGSTTINLGIVKITIKTENTAN
jgi:hypothetical protein